MIREEFIQSLEDHNYSYEIEGDKIVVIGGYAGLESLTSLPPGVVFRNRGDVDLDSLASLPPGVEFNNRGDVYLESLIGGYFNDWKGNIDGIDEKILLNKMISLGLFENKR